MQPHEHDATEGKAGPMGHGGGVKGLLLMAVCCLPMIAIAVFVVVGLLR